MCNAIYTDLDTWLGFPQLDVPFELLIRNELVTRILHDILGDFRAQGNAKECIFTSDPVKKRLFLLAAEARLYKYTRDPLLDFAPLDGKWLEQFTIAQWRTVANTPADPWAEAPVQLAWTRDATIAFPPVDHAKHRRMLEYLLYSARQLVIVIREVATANTGIVADLQVSFDKAKDNMTMEFEKLELGFNPFE
jgi:hypothetical protein